MWRYCWNKLCFSPLFGDLSAIFIKFENVRMFALMKSWTSMKMGHVGSKTRSQGQILKSPIFGPMLMKLGQNVCRDEISDEFENGSCGVKTRSQGEILKKPCICSRGLKFGLILMNLCQNVCLNEISDEFENGSFLVKKKQTRVTRS